MGCTTSKLDDLPAVALCRDRCGFLEAAIQQRYALSESHVAYTQSLKLIGPSLHSFINHHHRFAGGESHDDPDDSPISDSGSGHIEFDSDSDEIDSLHHSDHSSSPLHHHLDDDEDPGFTRYSNPGPPPPPSYSGSYLHMNYMKNSSMPPSVVYEQRPSSPQRVYIGDSSTSNPYPNYGPGSSPSSSKPLPSPPKSEAWDFLNLFDYAPYTLTRDSREVREKEGIPDLEEMDFQREVVKEVQGKQKFAAGKPPVPAAATVDDKEEPPGNSGGQASLYQTRPSVSVENEEKEVHLVEKKVVEDGGDKVRRSNAAPRGGWCGGVRRGVPEVAKEIEVQFLRAAESGSEVAVILEVGKLPYGRKNVSSKKMQRDTPSPSVLSSSQPSTSKKAEASSSSVVAAPTYAEIESELALRSRNLSSTLDKLHLWEKKLYVEVKAEEKLRVLHEKKLRTLKRLDERGAEAPKVDSTRRLVRSLSTKIRIAIQVVDKVSVTINNIRDEELWLQLNGLIQGLSRMWKAIRLTEKSNHGMDNAAVSRVLYSCT
ncbi:nitrate regulatory gene2 protein [Eutrema salsugineum]|uniref:nitrate regulatory gene2 protein n=1 Tax=Eutrema salsugineum TaxID=72664 RepID=UPI000CECF58F|nr:nitrate regulatory gene2 protein [Eutrema salsugineum]